MTCFGEEIFVPNQPLHEIVWERSVYWEDRIAMVDCSRNGESITFRELCYKSKKCTSYLQKLGVKPGDFVAVIFSNSINIAIVMLGIMGCGAVIVPSNPKYKKGEIIQQFSACRPKIIFAEDSVVSLIKVVKEEHQFIEVIIAVGESQDFITLNEILEKSDGDIQEVSINPNTNLLFAASSSGTTGRPKCMCSTHTSFCAGLDFRRREILDSEYILYIDRPMYHSAGYSTMFVCLTRGMKFVFDVVFEPKTMLKNIEKYKVTEALCMPPAMVDLSNTTGLDEYDVSSWKYIMGGSAPTPHSVLKKVVDIFKKKFINVYAITEAGVLASGEITESNMGSAGKVRRGVQMKIVNTITGQECKAGEVGEILVRGPMVTVGYLNDPHANAKAFSSDGWFHTGDLARNDGHGNLYIVDRIKEIIDCDTVQISPVELESIIMTHPKVADAAVVGIPHEKSGQVPKAFVVRKDQSLTKEEVHKVVEENLTEYKRLKGGIEFVDNIPKSRSGKIQRDKLLKNACSFYN